MPLPAKKIDPVRAREDGVQVRIIRKCVLRNGCFLWQGGTNSLGYGLIKWLGERFLVHRIIWAVYNDQDIPDGYTIDHLCRVRNCVRPSHLEAVTHQENCRRRNDRRSSESLLSELETPGSYPGDGMDES